MPTSTRRLPSARLSLIKPSAQRIRSFVAEQRELDLSYDPIGITRSIDPTRHSSLSGDYNVDAERAHLGSGQASYAAAVAALKRWAMFDVGWVELCWPNTGICAGSAVGLLAHVAAGWVLNAARIVYVESDSGPIERFAFATGTLPGHLMRGEERFAIEWNRRSDSVSFQVIAVSRPNNLLSWLSYPVLRSLQRRFRRDSIAAIHKAIAQ